MTKVLQTPLPELVSLEILLAAHIAEDGKYKSQGTHGSDSECSGSSARESNRR
jgi:hypothetical protein